MKSMLVFIAAIVMSHSAFSLGLDTGKDVLVACQVAKKYHAGESKDNRGAESCVHFLMGFDSGQTVALLSSKQPKMYCQPEGTNIGSMISATIVGLENNPKYLEAPAGIAVWKALTMSWPCRGQK